VRERNGESSKTRACSFKHDVTHAFAVAKFSNVAEGIGFSELQTAQNTVHVRLWFRRERPRQSTTPVALVSACTCPIRTASMSDGLKAMAKAVKAKGLQRLRWYCQMCQKQCRDENGFKCHQMSDGHVRMMAIFAGE